MLLKAIFHSLCNAHLITFINLHINNAQINKKDRTRMTKRLIFKMMMMIDPLIFLEIKYSKAI